jgi:hypothetical protein
MRFKTRRATPSLAVGPTTPVRTGVGGKGFLLDISADGSPLGETRSVLAVNRDGIIRHAEVYYRMGKPERLEAAVLACLSALGQPATIVSDDEALLRVVSRVAPQVMVKHDRASSVIQEFRRVFVRNLPAKDDEGRAAASPSSLAIFQPEFQRVSERLMQVEPWDELWDSDMVHVMSDTMSLTYSTFIVLGAAGEQYGIVGFRDANECRRFTHSVQRSGPLNTFAQVGLMYYTPVELPPDHVRAFRDRDYEHDSLFPIAVYRPAGSDSFDLMVNRADCRALVFALEAIVSAFEQNLLRKNKGQQKVSTDVVTPTFGTGKVTIELDPERMDDDEDDDDDASGISVEHARVELMARHFGLPPWFLAVPGPNLLFDHNGHIRMSPPEQLPLLRDLLALTQDPSELPPLGSRPMVLGWVSGAKADMTSFVPYVKGIRRAELLVIEDQQRLVLLGYAETPIPVAIMTQSISGTLYDAREELAKGFDLVFVAAGGGALRTQGKLDFRKALWVTRWECTWRVLADDNPA